MQNKQHISALKSIIGDNIPIKSLVVFSNECTLKEISITSPDVYVANLRFTSAIIKSVFTDSSKDSNLIDIETIYDKLYPYTQADKNTKNRHNCDIRTIKTTPESIM